jgi:hypothetical protein
MPGYTQVIVFKLLDSLDIEYYGLYQPLYSAFVWDNSRCWIALVSWSGTSQEIF